MTEAKETSLAQQYEKRLKKAIKQHEEADDQLIELNKEIQEACVLRIDLPDEMFGTVYVFKAGEEYSWFVEDNS